MVSHIAAHASIMSQKTRIDGPYTLDKTPNVANNSGDKPKKLVTVATVMAIAESDVIVSTCAELAMILIIQKMVRKIQPELLEVPWFQDTAILQRRAAT